ncbi:unnamed protein product [Effrenium voratum]|uniref:Acyltransferase 3 domain-containing protein n=1 Tax=Effrenium voratum TaxID=2562239 RepID=A0AA36NCU2_9DINO|nr:unnamed protein product [Effrenium voratum]
MAELHLDITFDEDNRIRVMPKEKLKQTEQLEAECQGFAEKIGAFSGTVDMLVEVLDGEAAKIEEEKMRAIGQIVCGHYMPRTDGPVTFLGTLSCRSFVAVDVFVVMSGFVTHLAYGHRLATWSLRRFYLRRMGQIVVTTWVAMLTSIVVVLVVPEYRRFSPGGLELAACLGFLRHWARPGAWCPAPPSWTVEALIPCWLLYPFLAQLAEKIQARRLTACFMVLLYLASFGPMLCLYWAQGGTVSWAQFSTSFMWPPAQVADFGLGVLAAELGKGEHDFRLWKALIADLAFAASAAAVMLLPVPGTHAECQEDHNALLSHGCSLAIAVFIYGSQHGSCVAHLLSHPALVALGKYSFEVYLFQWPLQAVLRQLLGQWPFEPDVFMGFLLLLWLLAGLYVEYVAPTTCIRALE